MGLIDVYRINPADAFSVYSPTLKKTQEITYYTLLAKIRGDLNITSVYSNIDNWNEAYDQVVVSGAVTGYETKTITLTRRDGSTISFDFEDLNTSSEDPSSQSIETLDTVTTRGNVTLNTIDVGGVTTDYVLFDTAATPTLQVGMMAWNPADGTVDLRMIGNNVTLQLGQEQLVRVVNKVGADLLEANYQAVKITGAQGNRLKIGLARGDNDANSADTIGIVTETIANNQEGFVTSSGLVRNINTTGSLQGETWIDGNVLYLSPTTFGAITNIKPLAPQHTVILGFVVRAHVTQGQIYVKVDNGYELDELHNVRIISEANNDTLLYDSTLSVWKNVPITSVAATLSFSTIAVSGQFSIVADSTSDTLTVAAGTGMSITTNAGTDTLTITNNDRGSSQNIFKNIAVAGQTTVVADNNNDTLTLIAGANVTITTDAVNDTITINSTGGGGGASGTVTYIDVVGGTGISTTGGPVTTTGTITVTNTDKGSDQFIFKNVAVATQSTIVADSNNDTLTVASGTGISITTNATTDTLTIANSAPDQTVVLTAGANVGITGTYPSFTISSTDQFVGTVTSVNLTAGTGMSVSGGPITSSGSITVTNTDRGSSQNIFKTIDVAGQSPVLATSNTSILELQAGTGMTITTSAPGSWVRFNNSDTGSAQNIFKNVAVAGQSTIVADSNDDTLTAVGGTGITLTTNATTDTLTITNSAPDQVVTLSSGTGISVSGAYPNFTVTNTAPDQVVSITGAGTSVVTGTYPNFTVTSADQYAGTVTSVGLTAGTGMSVSGGPITSSGSITVTNSDRGSSQNIFKNIAVPTQTTITASSNNDTFTIKPGSGISATTTGNDITISNTDPGSAQNIFKNVAVAGQSTVVADGNNDTLTLAAGSNVTITTDATTDTITINATGGGGGGGTVTSVDLTAGTGISVSGGPITSSGSITVTNTDTGSAQNIFKNFAVAGQSTIVADSNNDTLTTAAGTGITLTTNATTDTLTITNSAPDQVVSISAGTGISTSGTYPNFTVTNTAPDQTVSIASGTGISVTGAYPSFTVTNNDSGSSQNIFKNIAVAGQNTIVADSNNDTLTMSSGTGIAITTNDTTDTLTVTNSAPDQIVSITGAGTSVVTGTYPNFTVTSADQYVGTVTSVNLTAGTGMSVSGGPITSSGSITVTNNDRGSSQNIFKNIAVAGQNTIVADSNNDTLTMSSGTGITITTNDTTDTLTVTNSAPDQVVSITGAGTSVVTGTYPNFTVTSADQYVGTVTSVNLTAGTGMSVSGGPITSSGSITVTNNDRGSSQNIFKNIAVPTQTTITASSNNDTFTIKPGSGISATTLANDITLSNTDPGSAQAIFKNVAVSGQSTVVADTNNDTLTLVAGTNVTITTNATTDSVTINASIPTSATPGDAEYARDYATPFVVPSTWAMVNLNSTNIRVGVNKDLSADNRGYFFVTFEVESTQTGPQFRMFKYKLYNSTAAADVVDSESYWVGYMYGTSEVPYTTFSFHIPSADAGVDTGDTIELHVQELSSGTAPDITYAALSYIDAVG